jgi:CRISPR-associated protein Csm3
MTERRIILRGRVFLKTELELLTGLHIGGAAGGLEIGGVDKPVIRNPLTRQPYIPGSSLKGKLRSLMEKATGAPQTFDVKDGVSMHVPESSTEYQKYPTIAAVFGTLPQWGPPGRRKEFPAPSPTRLTVRDVQLTDASRKKLEAMKTDLPLTEIKWEAAIDRVTSAAAPRQIERVPAGAVFGPAQFIFSVYTGEGEQPAEVALLFDHVIEALTHLEDDYLGGMGSRGNGQVRLNTVSCYVKRITDKTYGPALPYPHEVKTLQALDRSQLKQWLHDTFAE